MKMGITSLQFRVAEKPFGRRPLDLDSLTKELKHLEKKAGTKSLKFTTALGEISRIIRNRENLAIALDSPIKVRAFAVLLQSELKSQIEINTNVLNSIDEQKPNPGALLIQSVYQHYLARYDFLPCYEEIAAWLRKSLKNRGKLSHTHSALLRRDGPKWIASQATGNNREFMNELEHLNLKNYAEGRYLEVAKSIYYVKQLENIPRNRPHSLLIEIQNKRTFNSRYDETFLLGHKILDILIRRAPASEVHESWLNVVLAIAGDPRVPESHQRHQKWWSALDASLKFKVQGWLSRLDLHLFLGALKDFSDKPGNHELKRMFPARKMFLEGLLKKKRITGTRLYLAQNAITYLRANYKREHLPAYSRVTDGGRSIIHVQLGGAHMIEGSHSCYLRIYPELDDSANVFDYSKTRLSYNELTSGLSSDMALKGTHCHARITHNPFNFSWQRKAISALNEIGVNISAVDVLSGKDYLMYKRIYGGGHGNNEDFDGYHY